MGFTVKSLDTESLDNTLHTFTSGNTVDVNAFVHVEDITNADFLFEFSVAEINFIINRSSVNLDFHNLSLGLSELELSNLGGSKNSDNGTVLGDTVNVSLDGFLGVLGLLIAIVVLAECLLFGSHPVFVHATLDIGIEVLGPDGGKSSKTTWCLNITDHTDNLHGWAFNNGAGVDDIFLDHLLTFTSFLVLNDVSHTGLVSHECGHMRLVGLVIAGE